MRFFQVAALVAAAASVSASFVRRDAQTLLNDIATISSKAKAINTTVSNFNGDIPTALQINSQSQDLTNSLNQATRDAQASNTLSNTDAANVVNAVAALQPVVYDTLATLVRKKPQFAKVVLGTSADALVESDVKSLKTGTDNFAAALTTKLPTVLAKLAPFLTSNLDFHYQQALDAYST